jgi:tRNA (adenine22-N1)-methyltransferase
MVKLSERLTLIAEQVVEGSRVADIGSDHALLPTYLVQQGKVTFAVAGEVNPGPYEAAQKQVKEAGLEQHIHVRRGDGLAVLRPDEVDTITIAGMGGSLMVNILTADASKLTGVTRLVLQPNVGEENVRRWLVQNDWILEKEIIIEEDGKIYEMMTALKSDQAAELNQDMYRRLSHLACGIKVDQDLLYLLGPMLMQEANSTFMKKWNSELEKLERIHATVGQSQLEASKAKAVEISLQIARLKEVLRCLQKARP